ncbi:MAG: hypothetical protein V4610_12555 [Pseudomonadota bacterium]
MSFVPAPCCALTGTAPKPDSCPRAGGSIQHSKEVAQRGVGRTLPSTFFLMVIEIEFPCCVRKFSLFLFRNSLFFDNREFRHNPLLQKENNGIKSAKKAKEKQNSLLIDDNREFALRALAAELREGHYEAMSCLTAEAGNGVGGGTGRLALGIVKVRNWCRPVEN